MLTVVVVHRFGDLMLGAGFLGAGALHGARHGGPGGVLGRRTGEGPHGVVFHGQALEGPGTRLGGADPTRSRGSRQGPAF